MGGGGGGGMEWNGIMRTRTIIRPEIVLLSLREEPEIAVPALDGVRTSYDAK